MRLQILLTLFLQVAGTESLRKVSGYLGDNVTLPSGASPSWTLSRIIWSIFSNNTWIATYRDEKKNIDRISQYKGRLSLNTSTGDLTIHNLNANDAMDYTLDLINTEGQDSVSKFRLIVRQPLQLPTIQTSAYTSNNTGCWMELRCSSVDTDVNLSWQVQSPNVTHLTGHGRNSGVLLAFLSTTQNFVEFKCTSSRNMENASSVTTLQCHDNTPSPQPPPAPPRHKYIVVFFAGTIVGGLLTAGLCFFRKQIKAAWDSLKGILPSCNPS